MVNLVSAVDNKVLEIADNFAEGAVKIAKGNAPKDSGKLIASINMYKTGRYSYLVTTDAVGSNGFDYPARVEAGEAVYPNPNGPGYIWFHGGPHLFASDSAQSHFMQRTMEMLHI